MEPTDCIVCYAPLLERDANGTEVTFPAVGACSHSICSDCHCDLNGKCPLCAKQSFQGDIVRNCVLADVLRLYFDAKEGKRAVKLGVHDRDLRDCANCLHSYLIEKGNEEMLRFPVVGLCGHSVCSKCLRDFAGECPICSAADSFTDEPCKNFVLVDVLNLLCQQNGEDMSSGIPIYSYTLNFRSSEFIALMDGVPMCRTS